MNSLDEKSRKVFGGYIDQMELQLIILVSHQNIVSKKMISELECIS